MSSSFQREWLTDLLESAPSLVFFALLRSGNDLDLAGWIGTGLAAMVLFGFLACRIRYNPILLGINVHLFIITPLIVSVYQFGFPEVGATLTRYSQGAVLVTIFLVGIALTLVSRDGFIGAGGLSPSATQSHSAKLLIATLAAMAWALTHNESVIVGVALPIIALFGLRRFLIARWLDRNNQITGISAIGTGAMVAKDTESGAVS